MISATRRSFLAGTGALLSASLATVSARADSAIVATSLGVKANSGADQSRALQAALNTATDKGQPLFLPAGIYIAEKLVLPSGCRLIGIGADTIIQGTGNAPVLIGDGVQNIAVATLTIAGKRSGPSSVNLIRFGGVSNFDLRNITVQNGGGNGLRLDGSAGRIEDSQFSGFGLSAIHAQDSLGLLVSNNYITECANGGIRIWRSAEGPDGSIVTGNRISAIYSQSGNGQNGNGINVFRADEVIVTDNHISDCDFSAVRLNTTNNTIVRGNMCTNLREVGIFSEFAFSGSVIADNIVDEAAYGISMTNFNDGGRLAVCSGNMVRNIWPKSPTNPDTRPVGIMAQADAAVTGNVVENVPGIGIAAGWGPFLRDVLIANNSVVNAKVGIGVSVAEGAGNVRVAGNLISGSDYRAISGMAWTDPKGKDLTGNPNQFANVTVEGNSVS